MTTNMHSSKPHPHIRPAGDEQAMYRDICMYILGLTGYSDPVLAGYECVNSHNVKRRVYKRAEPGH